MIGLTRSVVKPRPRTGAAVAFLGFLFIVGGLFGSVGRCAVPGVPCPSPSWNEIVAYVGLGVLVIGIALLIWTGWRGSAAAWVLGAVAVVPAVWFLYEIGRQELCPLISDPAAAEACLTAYGEMTAPVLSYSVGGVLLGVGWLRLRQRRLSMSSDSPRRGLDLASEMRDDPPNE